MDCYGWLIAPFQLLSCTQKQQAEAKIMDLFSTHPLRSVSDFMWSQMHVGRLRGMCVNVCVCVWEHMPMYMAVEVCERERETARKEECNFSCKCRWVFAEWVQKYYIFIDKNVDVLKVLVWSSGVTRETKLYLVKHTHTHKCMHECGHKLPHKHEKRTTSYWMRCCWVLPCLLTLNCDVEYGQQWVKMMKQTHQWWLSSLQRDFITTRKKSESERGADYVIYGQILKILCYLPFYK